MEKFKINANIVLDFMIENHYSEHSLSQYKRIYETMGEYLTENNLSYSPELGWELLDSGSDAPFGSKGKILHVSIPWLQSHSIRYREPSIPNDRAT